MSKFANNFQGRNNRFTGGGKTVVGVIEGNQKGFGFLITEDGDEDLFVPANAMNGAMHGDAVQAVAYASARGGEAKVVKVLERGYTELVGRYEQSGSSGFVVPDNRRFFSDIYIPQPYSGGARDGQKVVCEIESYPAGKKPVGMITEILGYEDEKGVDILSIIRSYGLREKFPIGVMKQARECGEKPTAEDIEGREDFRGDMVITIDGDDSKDFDDAVSLKKTKDGYSLWVHIADVAHYVQEDSKLDKEAYRRGTSVYLCDRVIPMLPKELSNGICSLNEGVDRLTLSVVMQFDNSGNMTSSRICEGVIKSAHRMTYSSAAAVIDGDEQKCKEYADVKQMLLDMNELAHLLKKKREKRGSIEFDLSECHIVMGEDGKVKDITRYEILESNKLIEEFMLAANETVAEKFAKMNVPFVFRTHETPSSEKVQALVKFLSALGIRFHADLNKLKPSDFAALLISVDESVKPVVNRVTLRSMMKAAYEPKNKGHFGLAASYYCHFTSPIRRYPDLAIHRIIKQWLRHGEGALKKYGQFAIDASKHSSEREKVAESAERDVDDLKKAEFMLDKIGNFYDGVVSGVTEWGIFVELDFAVEGLVRTAYLPDGNYVFNPDTISLDCGLRSYRIGDSVRIVVDSVEPPRINFRLV